MKKVIFLSIFTFAFANLNLHSIGPMAPSIKIEQPEIMQFYKDDAKVDISKKLDELIFQLNQQKPIEIKLIQPGNDKPAPQKINKWLLPFTLTNKTVKFTFDNASKVAALTVASPIVLIAAAILYGRLAGKPSTLPKEIITNLTELIAETAVDVKTTIELGKAKGAAKGFWNNKWDSMQMVGMNSISFIIGSIVPVVACIGKNYIEFRVKGR